MVCQRRASGLGKNGRGFFKKTVASGFDTFKEVKENFPKEASQFINKGKDEILKSLSQESIKNLISFSIEKFFKLAREHRLEFSVRIRRNEEASQEQRKK